MTLTVQGREGLADAIQCVANGLDVREIAVEGTDFTFTVYGEGEVKAPPWWNNHSRGRARTREERLVSLSKRIKRSARKLW